MSSILFDSATGLFDDAQGAFDNGGVCTPCCHEGVVVETKVETILEECPSVCSIQEVINPRIADRGYVFLNSILNTGLRVPENRTWIVRNLNLGPQASVIQEPNSEVLAL